MIGLGLWSRKWEREYGRSPFDEHDRPTADAVLWGRHLAGFTRETILSALEGFAQRGDTWPPNLPELRRACFNLPSYAQLKDRFTDTSDPFVLLVRRSMDSYLFSRAEQSRADRMLRDAYDLACEKVMQGEPLPVVPRQIKAEQRAPVRPTVDQLAKHFARIKEALHDE